MNRVSAKSCFSLFYTHIQENNTSAVCTFINIKVKTEYWIEKTDKLEHSDFTTQEQKKKVAIAINDRLQAVSADCISSLAGKNSVFAKSSIFRHEKKKNLWSFSEIVILGVNFHGSDNSPST